MRPSRMLIAGLVGGAVVLATSCSDKKPSQPNPTAPSDAAALLQRAQDALERSGSYTLTVEQSNFVLPQWGGVDGGTVITSPTGDVAEGTFTRTGEPGATYHIVRFQEQSFFQRSTCNSVFRVPGGGPDVLRPYLFGLTRAFTKVTDAAWVAGSGSQVQATLEGLGRVMIELDPSTGRPLRILGQSNGQPLTWSFSLHSAPLALGLDGRWDPGTPTDRGPGGIPC